MRVARSSPTLRTEPIPNRMASPPVDSAHGSNVAVAADRLTSGDSVMTPWRWASATSVLGAQNPMGCALSSPAQNAAGQWCRSQADAYTR